MKPQHIVEALAGQLAIQAVTYRNC